MTENNANAEEPGIDWRKEVEGDADYERILKAGEAWHAALREAKGAVHLFQATATYLAELEAAGAASGIAVGEAVLACKLVNAAGGEFPLISHTAGSPFVVLGLARWLATAVARGIEGKWEEELDTSLALKRAEEGAAKDGNAATEQGVS